MVFWISTVSWYVVWNNLYYIVIGLIIALIRLVLIFAKIRSGKLLFSNIKDWVLYIIKLIIPRLVFWLVMYIFRDILLENITILFVLSESFLYSIENYIGSLLDKILLLHKNIKVMLRGLLDELGKRTNENKMYMTGKEENLTNDKKNLNLNHIHFMQSDNDKGEGSSQGTYSLESEYIEYIARKNPFILNPLIPELKEPDLFYHIKVDQNYGTNITDMVNGYNDTVDESLIIIRTLYIDYQEALRNIHNGNSTVFLLREIREDILARIENIRQTRDLVETWISEFLIPQDSDNSEGSESDNSEGSESDDSSSTLKQTYSVSKGKRSRDDFNGSDIQIDSDDHEDLSQDHSNKNPHLKGPEVSETSGSGSHTETDTDICSIFESGLGMFEQGESSRTETQTNSESVCESPSASKRKRDDSDSDSDDSESEHLNKKVCSKSSTGQTIYPDGTTKGKSRADR